MSDLGSENMSCYSFSVNGSQREQKIIKSYLKKRGKSDINDENFMPYTCLKTLKIDTDDKKALKKEQKYLNSKLTLLKHNLKDKKNSEDYLHKKNLDINRYSRGLEEELIIPAQNMIGRLEGGQ